MLLSWNWDDYRILCANCASVTDAMCGTHFRSLPLEKQSPLLRLRVVALRKNSNYRTVLKAALAFLQPEVERARRHGNAAGLGVRLASLTSDRVIAHLESTLPIVPVQAQFESKGVGLVNRLG